ncbi:acetate--CoA ligase [Anthocerotibacter panamensis]|uniref:acetate--CoA ligase n=1 Tax=Anthocerotibacter panamensis TaxID=2857077 RepID=UPI001C4059F9|nr:acetate--CoA ligase [Anthocerotibacter panamensis]
MPLPDDGSIIESILTEQRSFMPSESFSEQAYIDGASYRQLYHQSITDPERFWAEQAMEHLHWFSPWEQTLDWQPPRVQWFKGGKLNLAYNCLDRHLTTERRHKVALVWEGEPGDTRSFTYLQLHQAVAQMANTLKELGITKGDRVGIYLPLIPEAAIAMLACARLGAPHSVVFGGFSAEALKDRLMDAQAKVVITADGGWRRGNIVALKENVDRALADGAALVQHVLVVKRTGQAISWNVGRDHWWHEWQGRVNDECPAEPMDAEDLLFILYTSGTTGKPKGIVHTTAGYNLYTHLTTRYIFDLKDTDLYWCTADIGWITGHSYVVYGPLSNGATVFLYEGAPNWPDYDRFWALIAKHRVNILYTAPTAIRAFMKWGLPYVQKHDRSSLRLLGTVGEPINPEAWIWYHTHIGQGRCPIVDTYWQTETGGIVITALPGAVPTKPGSAALPFFGIVPKVVNKAGEPSPAHVGGYLTIQKPWPGMMRTIYNDHDRFVQNYWQQVPGVYFTGDGAMCDEDGYFWVMGRVDDVLNVSGHRLGTMEVESALVAHPLVAEAAVVGRPDDIKGEAIVAFITLNQGIQASDSLAQELKSHVVAAIGAIARPEEIRFTDNLPKTRSGKIMRRLLRAIARGDEILGDTSTLEDRSALEQLRG